MTPFEKLLQSLTGNWQLDVTILAKAGVTIFLLLYLVFSLVVVKQVRLMSKTITAAAEPYLLTAAWALVGLSAVVLLLGLIIL